MLDKLKFTLARHVRIWAVALAMLLAVQPAGAVLRGDLTGDEVINTSDLTALVTLILQGNTQVTDVADVTMDGQVNVSDVTALVNLILYHAGPLDLSQPVVGGDVSLLTSYLDHGAVYRIGPGNLIDNVLDYYNSLGWNCMRVRIFVDPSKAPADAQGQGVVQDLTYVTRLCQTLSKAGFRYVLDFHYSDTWADPAHQAIPAAWSGLSTPQLAQRVFDYTSDVLLTLKMLNVAPEMVQVGNEISYGMLWPNGRVNYNDTTNWSNLATLLNAGCRAVRDVLPFARIILHTERTGDAAETLRFYRNCQQHGVDYDVIGLSYYPAYQGYMSALEGTLTSLEANFPDKYVMIMETGYPYAWALGDTRYDLTATYPYSAQGQDRFTAQLVATLKRHSRVKGLFWWWPEQNEYGLNASTQHVTDAWWNASLTDSRTGIILPAATTLATFVKSDK